MNLKTLIQSMTTESLALTMNKDGATITVLSNMEVKALLSKRFAEFEYIGENKSEFMFDWGLHKSIYWDNITRVLLGYLEEYNPIENYDKYSEIKLTDNIAQQLLTSNYGNRTTSVDLATSTSTRVAYDSESLKNVASTTSQPTASHTASATDTQTSSAHIDEHTTVEHTHGNIGVKTSSLTLIEEFDARIKSAIMWYINKFIDENTFYVGGVQ